MRRLSIAGRTRRRHPAAIARILTTGLAGAAMFGGVAAFAESASRPTLTTRPTEPPVPETAPVTLPVTEPPTLPVTSAPPVPSTIVVVQTVHRVVYVDENGNPIDPGADPGASADTTPAPAAGRSPTPSKASHKNASSGAPAQAPPAPSAQPAPAPAPAPAATAAPAPRPGAGGSACGPGVQGVDVLMVTGSEVTDWHDVAIRAMGSPGRLIVGDAPLALVRWALDELERLEQCWSRFRSDSELCRLNCSSENRVEVSATMLCALIRARELHVLTAGAFDPTVLDALETLGYDRTFAELEADRWAVPVITRTPPGFDAVHVDAAHATVARPPGVRLDLGGIGKGLAADLVVDGLIDRGARAACISMGGDIRVGGEPPAPTGWSIPVEDPFDEGRVLFDWPLTTGAIVTSTTRFRRWQRGGTVHHHLIDPRTGRSARSGIAAVVVTAAEAWLAEGYAKAALVAGPTAGAELLADAGLTGWMFSDDGVITTVGGSP